MLKCSYNEPEYEAIIAELQLTLLEKTKHIQVRSDSYVVLCQVTKEIGTKETTLKKCLNKVSE